MGLELRAFIRQLGLTEYDVRDETGIGQSIINRIARQEREPSAYTLLCLTAWADKQARRRRLPASQWLSWDWVYPGEGER